MSCIDSFTDVREIQRQLKEQGIALTQEADESTLSSILEVVKILLRTENVEVNAQDLRGGLTPLYYAAERPVVERDGTLIVVDDSKAMRWHENEAAVMKTVRFRTLGCWPVTGAVTSQATTTHQVIAENLAAGVSERRGRVSDSGSLEEQKRSGYF